MKVVILAGGLGTRLSEETHLKPKPMVPIGEMPILWHIMKIYSAYGLNEFIICLGYKGYLIKEFFMNYLPHCSDVTIDTAKGHVEYHRSNSENWKVSLIDTGEKTLTGGRLKRIAPYLPDDEPFCMTYGDGVAEIDIIEELAFHKQHGKQATLAAVSPPGRYGALSLDEERVISFVEKPQGDNSRINGGFFILEKSVIERIEGDQTVWENEPLNSLALDGELMAYKVNGFWQPMDTLREKHQLEALWTGGKAPWKIW
nr:glucose-1-phosphate cytidylyltransferase [uncultured Cohaesibacter sp.]